MSLNIHRQHMLLVSCLSIFGCVDGAGPEDAKPAPPEWSQWLLFDSTFFEPPRDILWVLNNSGSMCQEQKILRDNFDKFIDVLKDTSPGFHLGVTTTHTSATHPLLGRLVNVPDPIPSPTCVAEATANGEAERMLRQQLERALECLSDDREVSDFDWSDEQLRCALEGAPIGCAEALNIPDRDRDAKITIEDLFPEPADYRALPKVLKSEAYRMSDDTLDVAALKRDFGCMSLVGTRGDGFERGLQAAVMAVSPELTAPTKPNHGFLRSESSQFLIFVTDGDDCSSAALDRQASSSCQTLWCGDDPSHPLFSAPQLATSLRGALSSSLKIAQDALDVVVVSIHGANEPGLTQRPKPASCESMTHDQRLKTLETCDSELGIARAGDRYTRFMRQFSQYLPNENSKNDPLNFDLLERGWLCAGDFAPALTAVAGFIGVEPSCLDYDQEVILVLSPGLVDGQPHPYCGAPPVAGYGCAVDATLYERRPCFFSPGELVSFRQKGVNLHGELSRQTLQLWVPPYQPSLR